MLTEISAPFRYDGQRARERVPNRRHPTALPPTINGKHEGKCNMTAAELAEKIRDLMREAKASGLSFGGYYYDTIIVNPLGGGKFVKGENYAEIEPSDVFGS
jgi:hypothetical protein